MPNQGRLLRGPLFYCQNQLHKLQEPDQRRAEATKGPRAGMEATQEPGTPLSVPFCEAARGRQQAERDQSQD